MKGHPGLRKKTAKGKVYYYFETGAIDDKGKPVLKRLPDPSDPTFGRAYAAAKAGRGRRERETYVYTVRRLIDAFQKSREFSEFASSTQRVYNTYLAVICEQIGDAPVNDVTAEDDTLVMMDDMADRPGAANMAVRTLGALYAWGRKRHKKLVTANPVVGVELFEEGEHQPWPEWLLDRALAPKDKTVQLVTALLYYTGQRIGDVSLMRWTDITPENRLVGTQEKTKKSYDIPIHEDLLAILKVTPRRGFTIISQENGRPYNRSTLRGILKKWAAEQGLQIVPHGLRKNAVNALLEAGCSAAETASITRQTLQMVENYAKQRNSRTLATSAILKWEKRK